MDGFDASLGSFQVLLQVFAASIDGLDQPGSWNSRRPRLEAVLGGVGCCICWMEEADWIFLNIRIFFEWFLLGNQKDQKGEETSWTDLRRFSEENVVPCPTALGTLPNRWCTRRDRACWMGWRCQLREGCWVDSQRQGMSMAIQCCDAIHHLHGSSLMEIDVWSCPSWSFMNQLFDLWGSARPAKIPNYIRHINMSSRQNYWMNRVVRSCLQLWSSSWNLIPQPIPTDTQFVSFWSPVRPSQCGKKVLFSLTFKFHSCTQRVYVFIGAYSKQDERGRIRLF